MNKSITITETTRIAGRALITTVEADFITPYNDMEELHYVLINREMIADEAEALNPFGSYAEGQSKSESKPVSMQEFVNADWDRESSGVHKLIGDIESTRNFYPNYEG